MKQLTFTSSYIAGILAIALSVTGCVPMQQLQQADPLTLPTSFPEGTDSSSIGSLSWKQIFTDKHLQSLIDTALNNNWDLQSAIQRVEMARANYLHTRGALKPSVMAAVSAGAERFGDYTLNGVGNYDTNLSGNLDKKQKIPTPLTPDYFIGFKSSWEIDLWGKLRNRKVAAYHRLLSSQKGIQLVHTTLIAEVASRYYELLALDEEMEIIGKNIELQKTALEIVQVQKAGGRATELAVQQFSAQLLRTRGLETDFRQQIAETENELNLLLGRLPQPIIRSQSILKYSLPKSIQAGIPASLLFSRPDIQQAELELKATEVEVAAARAAFFPSLTITPYLGLNSFSAFALFNPASIAFGALGGLTAPILNRTAVNSEYNRSIAVTREAFNNYQKAVLNGYNEVVINLSKMKNLQVKYELKENESTVLNAAVSTSNDLYLAGFASYLEVITAQKNVVETELALITTKKEILLTLINLYRALGGGRR